MIARTPLAINEASDNASMPSDIGDMAERMGAVISKTAADRPSVSYSSIQPAISNAEIVPSSPEEGASFQAIAISNDAAASHQWDPDYAPGHYTVEAVREDSSTSGVEATVLVAALAVTSFCIWIKRAEIMKTVKQRAALVACLGIALIAASLTVLTNLDLNDGLLRDVLDNGWITLFGALLALIGVYHWIAQPNMP